MKPNKHAKKVSDKKIAETAPHPGRNKATSQVSRKAHGVIGKLEFRSAFHNPFLWALFAVFVILSYLGAIHHELWDDELQAWLIATESTSLRNLIYNLRFEGHPALWHSVLMYAHKFTKTPEAMQLIHMLSACGVSFLILFKSPFSTLQKGLMIFGYFFLFEYNVICRNYSFGILLYFIIINEIRNIRKSYWWLAIIAILLCNTNLYAAALGATLISILCLAWLLGGFDKKTLDFKRILVLVLGFAGGLITAYLQIKPGEHGQNYIRFADGFDIERIKFSMVDFTKVFFPFSDMSKITWWNTNIFIKEVFVITNAQYYLAILIFIVLLLIFIRKPYSFLLFGLSSLLVCVFTYITFIPYMRFIGHILVALIGAYWLDAQLPNQPKLKIPVLGYIGDFMYAQRNKILVLILLLQVFSAGMAYYSDWNNKFSRIKDTADFIKEKAYDKNMIFGYTDYGTFGVCAYLNKPLFFVQRDTLGKYINWDDKRNHSLDIKSAVDSVMSKIKDKHGDFLFLSSMQILLTKDGVQTPLEDSVNLNEKTRLVYVNKFDRAIAGSDNFYLYRLSQ